MKDNKNFSFTKLSPWQFCNPDSLQAGFSIQTNELRLCGVDADAETVMVAFYDQTGKLMRIETFTASEVASGVLLTEVDSQHTFKIMQTTDAFTPVADAVTS